MHPHWLTGIKLLPWQSILQIASTPERHALKRIPFKVNQVATHLCLVLATPLTDYLFYLLGLSCISCYPRIPYHRIHTTEIRRPKAAEA
jgi:hypothetical protein